MGNTSERKNDEKANALRELALKEKQEIMRVKEEATKSALLQNRENQELRVTSDQDKECSKIDEECLAVEEKKKEVERKAVEEKKKEEEARIHLEQKRKEEEER